MFTSLRIATLAILCLIVGASRAASAEEAPSEIRRDKRMLSVHALLVMPHDDADDVAKTSPGLRATVGYQLRPWLAPVASFEYVFVSEEESVGSVADVTFYSFGVGARFSIPKRARLRPFVEVLVGRHTYTLSSGWLGDQSESEFGFRAGGGVHFEPWERIAIAGQVSYSMSEIEDSDINGLVFEAGVAVSF